MTREEMIDEAVALQYAVKIGDFYLIGTQERDRLKRHLPKIEAGQLPGAVAMIRRNFRCIWTREQQARDIQERGT